MGGAGGNCHYYHSRGQGRRKIILIFSRKARASLITAAMNETGEKERKRERAK